MTEDVQRLLECKGICKSFSKNSVLNGIDFVLNKGEVISIIGGNGAGKSTLMKIIMGVYKSDRGTIIVGKEQISDMNPNVALDKGIYLVPQEPMLFPNMTVEDNIFLGLSGTYETNTQKLQTLLNELGWEVNRHRLAITLSIAEQQLVEILKGLMREPSILILDEPTSSLTYNEVTKLFEIIAQLKAKGVGVLYITHRLNEVFQISDKILILRDGKISLTGPTENFTEQDLIKGLLPENYELQTKRVKDDTRVEGKAIFEVKNYCGNGFKDISFEIKGGEILGLAGVVGAGRTELAETIFGRDEVLEGQVLLDGIDITAKTTKEVIEKGLNYIPEDRFKNGIFSISSIHQNLTSATLSSMKGPFLDDKVEANLFTYFKDKFKIVCRDGDQAIGDLSGGNQQKIVIAKSVASMPRVLILDEPTRGIDAAAREDVYNIIDELKSRGVAVLLISSDMEEIVQLSNRVLSMYHGKINGEFVGKDINVNNLTSAIFGVKGELTHEKAV